MALGAYLNGPGVSHISISCSKRPLCMPRRYLAFCSSAVMFALALYCGVTWDLMAYISCSHTIYVHDTGYIAPEMLIQRQQARHVRKGYTQAVDFWSLGNHGVCMYTYIYIHIYTYIHTYIHMWICSFVFVECYTTNRTDLAVCAFESWLARAKMIFEIQAIDFWSLVPTG